ncbi:MAG: multiheme c-type cytochrome [Gemmatimonadota bacterium]
MPSSVVAESAHGELPCLECHDAYGAYPHTAPGTARSCTSCHEPEAEAWRGSIHAMDGEGTCQDCHGIHDVVSVAVYDTPDGARGLNDRCGSCHYEAWAAARLPHGDSVSCAGCHDAHRTLPPEDEGARVHVIRQGGTCGTCHDTIAASWSEDAHGRAVPLLAHPGGSAPAGASRGDPPACSACHGAHGMLAPGDSAFSARMAERCAYCHEPYAESFADSYHGQATTLGEASVASCYDCHGAHGVFPADDPRSTVSRARRLDTCRSCHPAASEGFILFQPHADPHDRDRYPAVYWSYHLMTALLIGVFGVFGAHTLLWLLRLGAQTLRDPYTPQPPAGG